MRIGHEVSIRTHQEAGALLVEQSVGLGGRSIRCRRRGDRLGGGKDRKIASTGHAGLPDLGHAMRQYRQ
jgi:hypothetical protein